MNNLHDHEIIGICQTVYWNQLAQGKQYDLLLIDFFRGEPLLEGKGYYQVYYAMALCDIEEWGTKKGDNLIFHISRKTWMKAIAFLPVQLKTPCQRKYAEGKNLYVKIERLNTKSIKIHHQEPREPTAEQLADAKKFYSIIKGQNVRGK